MVIRQDRPDLRPHGPGGTTRLRKTQLSDLPSRPFVVLVGRRGGDGSSIVAIRGDCRRNDRDAATIGIGPFVRVDRFHKNRLVSCHLEIYTVSMAERRDGRSG
jgi:hypothetical protein